MSRIRFATAITLVVCLLSLAGCSPAAVTKVSGRPAPKPSHLLGTDVMYPHVTKYHEPSSIPVAAMDGEPSRIPFFRPETEEGVRRDYPAYDAKTFKFLDLPGTMIPPQVYYMMQKDGGSVNAALKGSGYKAAEILDTGHEKLLPNLYIGYYDFAWVSIDVVTEIWSGNVSVSPELWRAGDNYTIIAGSYNRGVDLIGPPDMKDASQLAGKTVGIMNVGFNFEAELAKKLKTVGLASAGEGGNVKFEMGTPGFVMNDLIDRKAAAVFPWARYSSQLVKQFGFHTVVPWDQMGYGKRVPAWVLLARKDIVAKHPDIVQKIVQLNYDASQQALNVGDYKAPERARKITFESKFMGNNRIADPAMLDDFAKGIDPQANPVFLKDLIDYMTRMHYFVKPYTYGQLVDQSFYDKVKK